MGITENKSIQIEKKSFITAVIILLSLMILVGISTKIIPTGAYERTELEGREVIVADSFAYDEHEPIPVWRWFTAPVEVLFSEDGVIIIVIIVFLLFIGGAVTLLNYSKVLAAIIGKVVKRFKNRKYLLLGVLLFVFMSFGAFIGMFEEVIALVPVMIALSLCFGWDEYTGISIVLLGSGFGFTAAVSNPFTIGVAQEMADLPLFSGAIYRLIIFLVTFVILAFFVIRHAKKVEQKTGEQHKQQLAEYEEAAEDKSLNKGVVWFVVTLFVLFVLLMSGSFISILSEIALPLVGLLFFVGAFGASMISGMSFSKTLKVFGKGALDIAPAIILILMASSVKHIIMSAGILDTILYYIAASILNVSPYVAVPMLFFIIFFMDFLIGSGSAKAFLIMPLIVPISDIIHVNRQVMVLAFQFGDGFSNVVFPTNPVLIISLGLAGLSYGKWIRKIWKLELVIIVLSVIFLELGVLFGYGPF